ncbi:MAG: SDR family NAD(P)-dependent oxidoreductase [Myxococcota bacterium]|nr:SDR family NAD(P)-dependent oxidoreductase [Myxococcota bacterium]
MKQTLITGANTGLGLAASKMLARAGHHVIMLCRSPERGAAALAEVAAEGSAELVLCDLSDFAQIRRLSETFAGRSIDVLMHNAGIVLTDRQVCPQGFERTISVNHLAPYLLTHTLWGCLSRGSRVVIVASDAHRAARLQLATWMAEEKFSTIQQYGSSKLCNILFSDALAVRAQPHGITVNCLHPGAVNTSLGDRNDVWYSGLGAFIKRFLASPEKGADTQVWLADSPEVEGQTGGYYAKRRLGRRSRQAGDAQLALEVWRHSAALLQLDPDWP